MTARSEPALPAPCPPGGGSPRSGNSTARAHTGRNKAVAVHDEGMDSEW